MPASAPSTSLAGTAADRPGARTWLGLAVVLTGAFIAMLDTFIVNVAVPSIRADLHASYGDGELVIAGYTLTYAIGQVAGGRLGDTYGRRPCSQSALPGSPSLQRCARSPPARRS